MEGFVRPFSYSKILKKLNSLFSARIHFSKEYFFYILVAVWSQFYGVQIVFIKAFLWPPVKQVISCPFGGFAFNSLWFHVKVPKLTLAMW